MARIQKKKAPDKTKKNRETGASEVSTGNSQIVGDGPSHSREINGKPDSAGDKKKKVMPLIGRPSGAGQSAIMKMIDTHFGTWIQFFREVRFELEKVAWPTRKQTIGSTAVVIVFVFILALFLGVVDMGLSSLIRMIL